jgi:succinoglycan biosynthesis transport protein ExoP
MNSSSQQPEDNSVPADHNHNEDSHIGKTIRNYWLMIRERKWYALTAFLLTVIIAAAYTFSRTPIYQSVAMVEVLRHGQQVLRVQDVVDSSVMTDVDFNTQIKILESTTMVQNVAGRLSSDEVQQLIAPYKSRSGTAPTPVDIILKGRQIIPMRLTLILGIQFRHPDRKVSARIANLFAEEYISYNSRLRVDEALKAVDELKDRADQQRKRVDEIANSLQAFRQSNNLISLEQNKDIVTEKLKTLNQMATQAGADLEKSRVILTQMQDWQKQGKDLTDLPFIASQPQISQLMSLITTQKTAVEELSERYKAKHPSMIQAVNTLTQTQHDLHMAVEAAVSTVQADYDNSLKVSEEAHQALADQETKSLELGRYSVEYDNLTREFRVNDELLQSMMARMRETAVNSTIETQSARIVDPALEPSTPVSPNISTDLTLGVLAGVVLGFGFAYLLAVIDDRVKSAFDIESLIGLPLLGIIPRIDRMEQPDKAQIVSNGADRMIVEAFMSLHSTLRLKDESRNAKLLLVTSTLPGEGKSFVTTNLALAFASQGQRTVVVDCDLRKPNIQNSFRLNTTKGVITYCLQAASLDEIVVKNVHPNLDVITTGGRAKIPSQVLNGKEFEAMVGELGKRYDRVLFDTPPLGAVSDALNILPLMDGAIYAIRFNRVRRGAAQRCVRRLLSANIEVFGAVLNDMDMDLVGDYYGEYYDKSYKGYYDLNVEEDDSKPANPPKAAKPAKPVPAAAPGRG